MDLFYPESRPVPKSLPKWKSALFESVLLEVGISAPFETLIIWGTVLCEGICTVGGTIPLWSLWVWPFIPPFNISDLMVCGL